MPGFVIGGTGNQFPIPNTIDTVRVNRWIIIVLGPIITREHLVVAKDFSLPRWNADRQEVNTTLTYKYAKAANWGDASIVFYDTLKTPSILEQLNAWRDLVFTTEGGVLQHNIYKRDSVVVELDGEGNPIRTFNLKNSWPSNIDYGKLSYADSTINLVELTLAVDYVEVE